MVTSWACVHGDGCDGGVDGSWPCHPRGYDEAFLHAAGDGVSGSEIDLLVILSWQCGTTTYDVELVHLSMSCERNKTGYPAKRFGMEDQRRSSLPKLKVSQMLQHTKLECPTACCTDLLFALGLITNSLPQPFEHSSNVLCVHGGLDVQSEVCMQYSARCSQIIGEARPSLF